MPPHVKRLTDTEHSTCRHSPLARRNPCAWARSFGVLAMLLAWPACLCPVALCADAWDELPCATNVVLLAGGQGGFSQRELAAMASRVAAGLTEATAGCCAASVTEAPPHLLARTYQGLESNDWVQAAQQSLIDKQVEKLLLVLLLPEATGWRIQMQEWDRHAGLGPLAEAHATRRSLIVPTVLRHIVEVVQLTAQLTMIGPGEAVIRLRCGRRPATEAQTQPAPGTLFRLCQPADASPHVPPYHPTLPPPPEVLLRVEACAEGTARCSVLRAQPSAPLPQGTYYAARLTTRWPSTKLYLVNSDGRPLAAFEAMVQYASGATQRLDKTASDGSIDVLRTSEPWCWVELRHGQVVLARLPCVAGWQAAAVWRVPLGDTHFEALAMLESLELEVEEAVLHRALLLARAQQALARGSLDEADRLLRELRAQPTAAAIKRRIDQQMRQISTSDPAGQDALRRMFADLSATVERHLDASAIDALADSLQQARNPPPPPGEQGGQPAAPPAPPEAGQTPGPG